jgi:hypothetical protein
MRPTFMTSALGTLTVMLFCDVGGRADDKAGPIGVKPLMTLYGSDSKITKSKTLRVTTTKEWDALWNEHRGDSKTDRFSLDLDFEKVMVIAIFGGEGFGEHYFTSQSIVEANDRITIRIDANTYQWGYSPDAKALRPWGILVLPRSNKKLVLESDMRGLIADPPKWKEWTSFPAMPANRKP